MPRQWGAACARRKPSLTQSLGSYISSSRQLDETMPSPQGGGYLSLSLESLLHLNWTRNGFIPMVGPHDVLFTNCCILMYQNKSPHCVPLWVLFKSKGPTGAACGVSFFFLLYAAWVRSRAERPSVSYTK